MFEAGPLLGAILESKAQTIILQGGTSSGKTYAALQAILVKLIQNPGWIATVVGQDIPNLKKGPIRDLGNIIESSKELQAQLRDYQRGKHYNKSDRQLFLANGSMLEFSSFDNAQDAKQGKRQILFANEANGITYEIWEQLYIRTTHLALIDYNPDAEFWVHEILLKDESLSQELLISDHRHNPFVPQSLRDKIEKLRERDLNLWRVYARGLTGRIEGLVFNNWKRFVPAPDQELNEAGIPRDARFLSYGMDFGYTNDPTTLIKIWRLGESQLLLQELLYERGLTGAQISDRLKALGVDPRDPIYPDPSEGRLIVELRRMGWNFRNVERRDGLGLINTGIDILKRYELLILPGSGNLEKELRAYKWQTDSNGNPNNKPVDFMNHLLDALRYGTASLLNKPERKQKYAII